MENTQKTTVDFQFGSLEMSERMRDNTGFSRYSKLRCFGGMLGLSDVDVDKAIRFYTEICEKDLQKWRKPDYMFMACLYAAARAAGVCELMDLRSWPEKLGLPSEERRRLKHYVAKYYRFILRNCSIASRSCAISPENYVAFALEKLKEKYDAATLDALGKKAMDKLAFARANPLGQFTPAVLAGACIYWAAQDFQELTRHSKDSKARLTEAKIAGIFGYTEVSLRNAYHRISRFQTRGTEKALVQIHDLAQ